MKLVRLAAAVAGAILVAAGIAWAANVPIGSPAPIYVVPLTNNGNGTADNASAGGAGGATVKATAADPTYVEGSTNNPISANLSGYQRFILAPNSPGITPLGQALMAQSTPVVIASDQLCGSYAVVSAIVAVGGDTQIVAQSGTKNIYICDYELSASAADNVYLEKAASGTCTSPTRISPIWYLGANVSKAASNPFYRGFNTGASQQLCIHTSSAGPVDVGVYYAQY